MNPWEQDWSGAAPQANDKAPWEQDWGKPSDVTKGGVLDTVRDYTLAGLSKAGQGSMQAIAGMADTVSAPVAKTRAMLTGAAALADRWLPGDINPTLQELAQDDAAAAEAKAQQNALNNPLARGTMALRDAARERGQMLQDFDKEFNPELVRQEGEMSKAQGFWENAKAIKDNPLAFYGNLMQSAPAMATGIGMSSGAARAAGALGKVAGMSDEAALALATRSAGAVGTASEAALSGSQAREGIRSNILATPHAQLAENSPRYQELMSQPGMTPALARDTLANEVSTSASLLTSAATALGSTVTNRVFGNLEAQMIAGNKLGAKDALLKMPAKETAEEAAQGMGEDYVQHRAMLPADKTNAYDPGGSFVQNAAAGLAMSGPGSVGGYARQQYNASRGLNPDGTKPATPPAAPPADVAMDIRFPDGTVSKDPGQTDSDTLRARYEVARKAAMDAQADPGANPRTIMVLNAESDRLGKEWQNSLKLKGAVSKDPAGGKFDYAAYDQYRTALESGGRADAKNPNSSATGLHQFTERTWLATVEQAKPAWANGLSREQILDARTDPAKSTEMVRVLDKQNATRLASEGQPVNEHTLYAAHHFGAGRAVDFAKAGDDVLMSNILSPSQMRANPYLEGLTKAQAIANWDSRAGGAPATASPAAKPAAESDIASTEADAAAEALQPREAADVDKVAELDKQAQALERRWNDLNTPEYGPTFDTERADLQSQIAALRGEREQLAKDWPKPEYGHPTSFATESGVRLDGRYALVDADALVTSHNSLLNKNGAYPQELQPRERDRAASEAQISGIVNKLDPARLGMSADAATGAPIIGADGVVESGNARTIALMRAYEANGQKAAEYRQFLSDNANQFGLSAEQVGALKNPVLVRVRDTPVDRAEFARQANASTVAAMSPSEQARSDAQRIDNMEDLTPNDDGDFATSRDFIRRFMARLPMTEQAGMVDSSGALSTAGYARVRNAVLAKAYGDSPVLQRLTESMDDNLRNISKALVMAAPEVAKMRSAIDAGARFDVDITPDLMAAVTELSRLKDAGTSVQDAIAQVGMFGEYSTEVRDLLQFLADNIRRPRRIADFVRAYYAALDQAGNPNQGSLLGETAPPAKGELMNAARQDAQGELLDGNTATPTRSATAATGDPGRAQAGPEGRVQRSDEARRGQGDQVDGAARSEAAVAFDFDATEKALEAERDATSESIESEWVNSKTGAEHRRRTDLESAIYDAVTSSSLDAENAGPIVDTAIQGGRLDLAEYAVKRAENYANSMGTTPGVSPSSPKYDGIKQNLERAKAQAIKAAAELRAKLEQAKGRRESPTGQWRAFPPDMGSLGIPRAEMPQIKGEHRGAFIQFLKGRGIEASEQHEVDAAKLKPTQAEFSMAKVEGFLKKGLGSGRSVLVSSDGYVLDGHHQWMAHAAANQDIPVITLNAPMRELLKAAHEFPSVQRSEGASNDPDASRREAVQDFKAAMADLADIATKWQRAALMPEKDAELMPVLARLFDAAIRIVGTDMRAATRWVKDQLRANPETKRLVNKIEPMSFRKAAEQAFGAMSEPPAQGGLFDSLEQASQAVQGDMFGLPEARPYDKLSAEEKAAFDRRQGIRASQRESAPRKVTSENYDAARDNYSPPDVSSFMPKEALAAADKVIAEHQSEKRTNAAPTISADDRARAESLLTPVLAKAAEAKAEFDQKVIDIAQRVGALGQQLAPLKGLKRGAEKLVEEKFDVGGMKDLLRSTIVVRSYADAQAVMDAIESEFKLLRAPKNRTGDAPLRAQGKDVAPEDPAKYAGYSDIMVNVVMPNGTIAEIQINTPDMLAAKGAQGHKLYEVLRAEPKGSATFDVVNAASLAFYAEARAAARNSSSVMRDQSAGQNPLAGLSPSQGAFSSSQNRLPSGNSTYDRSMPSPSARSMPKTQPGGNLSGTFIDTSDKGIVADREKPSNEPVLESHILADLKARQDARDAAERKRAKDDAEADRKAQADARRDGFTLTGSDRAVDVAEAHGQQPLLSRAEWGPDTQYRDTERAYGGREAYDKAKDAGKTKLTYGQWVQVRTPNFKRWFGDWEGDPKNASKVVNPDTGEPMVVYRGGPTEDWQSGAEITEFRSSNGPWAGFFTNSSETASRFANAQYALTRHGGKPAGVFPVYLSMQKPLEVDAGGKPARDFQIDASVLGKPDHPLRERMLNGDYDGLILRNTEDEGDVFVPLNPNQIKSATGNIGTFDASSGDIRLSRAAKASTRRNLIITHNLSPENLLHAVKMGGLAVPSLAITTNTEALSGFGSITLVGKKEMADPQGYGRTQVFGADIYSPRYPKFERIINAKQYKALEWRTQAMADELGQGLPYAMDLRDDGYDTLERSPVMLGQFLKDNGITPAVVWRPGMEPGRAARLRQFGLWPFMRATDPLDLRQNPAFRKAGLAELLDMYADLPDRGRMVERLKSDEEAQDNMLHSLAVEITNAAKLAERPELDRHATVTLMRQQLDEANLGEQYQQAINDTLEGLTDGERIFNGFTNLGNRRYIPHTLENVVKILKKGLRGGESFNYGVGSLRAHYAPQFRSVDAIRKAKDRLVSAEQFERIKKEIDAELESVASAIDPNLGLSEVTGILEEAARKGVRAAFKEYGHGVSDAAQAQAQAFLDKLRSLPTAYFEAKITRAVALDEFAGAVVPNNLSAKALQALRDGGVTRIQTYKDGDEGSRKAAVQAFSEKAGEDVLFSRGGNMIDRDGAGVRLTDVQAMANRVAKALPNLPGVEVLKSTRDLPKDSALRAYLEKQGAMDDAEGAFHDGELYLFADNLASMERAEHVLATHEAGHAGLAAILGADRARVMQSLLNLNDDLNRRANAVAKRLGVPVTTAVEELLVDVPPADLVKLKGWRRVAHKVQQWLARSGFTALAARMGRWLESRLSDQQKADLLAAELMTAAREHLAGRKPKVRSMAVDAQQQARWLNKQAAQRGYENADAMALADFDGLESLMAQWRGKNPAAAMLARRIVRDGYRTVNDSVIPETPEYEGNLTGDLAQVPAGETVKAGPIRLPVGVAEGQHRGRGIEHMADNARRDTARAPTAETGELAEDLARQAVAVLRGVSTVHHDGRGYVFANHQMKQAVVAGWRGDHYSITTVRPFTNAQNLWGNSERIGRLTFPIRDAAATSPSNTVAKGSSLHPDRYGLEVASERFDFNTDKPKPATQVVVKKKRTIQVPDGAPRLSRAISAAVGGGTQQNLTPSERADALIQKSARTAQPLDAVAQAITRATGVEWAAKKVGSVIAGALNRYTPESVKAGLVSDYGLDPRVRDERVLMQARQQVQLRKAGEMIDSLASLTREESAAAYRWMNETDPDKIIRGMDELPEGSAEKLQEIQRVIDKLSQEAVDLGQLDQRSYERNKFAYLHRSYAKHVLEPKGAKAARARTVAILGNQYKGRGTTETVAMSMVRQTAPEWWDVARKAGKADPNLIGKKLTRYDRLAPSGAGTQTLPGMDGRSDGRVLETVYLPADRAAPKQYAEWRKGATFEVRDVKRGDLTLWRDWTADERQKMGEIDEARFAIAKTLHGMIRDVEVGRFLGWLSRTQAKPTEAQLPAGASIVDASESLLRAFKPGEWVKVPETTIAGTAVKKYGELAGKYVEGPVWNEVRQALHTAQGFGKVYGAILNAWKLSKTALSPTVHMNNIMSNFVMADWHDVTAGHVAKAMRILMGAYDPSSIEGAIGAASKAVKAVTGMADQDAAREIVKRYTDSGAELGSFVVNEVMKSQVDPLLTAMEAELKADPNSTAAQVGVMSALQLLRQREVGAAAKAASGAGGVRHVIREGQNLIDLYQSEDAVFRLASWLKAKEEGKSDIEAGRIARRSFMDYNINAPWVQAARKSVLPFVSYTYRAAPMLAEIAMNKPHKLLKLMAVAGAINALGTLLAGGGADDDKVRKLLPKEKTGGVWGMVPKLIRMPWNDDNGSPVFLDIRRWIPMGDVFDLGQGHAALPIPPSLMPGGPLALAGELLANKSQFTGKPIVLETDTAGQKAGKVADFVYKWATPNVLGLPGSYATTGVFDAAKGRTDAFGRERSVSQAIASSVGVKLASYPRDILERNIILESKGKQAELERGMRQLARQRSTNTISDAEFERAIGVEQGKLIKLREETQERLEAGR